MGDSYLCLHGMGVETYCIDAEQHSKRCSYLFRYWSMYKLPMFGCNDPSQVLAEIQNATKAFPDAYIRCAPWSCVLPSVHVVA